MTRHRWRAALGGVTALLLLGGLVLVLLGESVGGYAGLPLAPEPGLEGAVHEAFAGAKPDEVVVLAEVADLSWDAVGVFGPYQSHEGVVEVMEARVPQGATNNLLYDERCLLVFVADGRTVAWTTVSRDVAECAGEWSGRCYTPEEAMFGGDRLGPLDTP